MKTITKIFSWNEIQSSHQLMLLIIIVIGLLNFFWGEKIPAGGGFGWDGSYYAEMVRNLDSMINKGQLNGYYTQRILPSAIVRSMLLFSETSMSDVNIIRCFEIYNLTLLVGACFAWRRIANKFLLSLGGRWIGFSGIFINFQCSKQAFYYPVLTDVTALLVAILLLLFYVEKKPIALFFVTVIGAFCWPVVSVCGALLLILLGSELPNKVVEPDALTAGSINVPYLAKIGGLLTIGLSVFGYLLLTQIMPVSEHACAVFNNQLQAVITATAPIISTAIEGAFNSSNPCPLEKFLTKAEQFLTALPSLFGLVVALIALVGSRSFFRAVLFNLRHARLLLVGLSIAAVLIPAIIVKLVSNPSIANPSSLTLLIKLALFPQEGKFLLSVVTLAVFWGPVVLLLLLYWKEFCVQARKLGAGVVGIIGISLVLGLVNEPRFLTIGWPFLVLGLILVLESLSTEPSFKYVLITLTILYSQFWLKLNISPWMLPDNEGLQDFPKQLYFMHYGLWMSWPSYLIQLPILILSTIWLKNSFLKFSK